MNLFNILIIKSLTIIALNVTLASRQKKSDDFQRHGIKLTVKPIGPIVFDVTWRLLSEVNTCTNYLLTYSSQHTSEVKFTSSNDLTLTELKECTAYRITIRCFYGVSQNVFGLVSSTTALTSHISRLKTVRNLTVESLSDSILITWESPDEQKLCVMKYHISLIYSRNSKKEIQTESKYYLITALEHCVTYYGHVSAVDFSGIRGDPVPFNITINIGIPGPVLKLSALSNHSKTIFVSWDKPISSSFCIHQYEVVYCHDIFICSTILTRVNYLTISQLKPCITYQITVMPKMENIENVSSAKTEVTVISEVLEKPMNGRVLSLTNYTATLQWDSPVNSACSLIHQVINCSFSNGSLEIISYNPNQVVVENLKPFTKYTCYSVFFNVEGYSAKSDEIMFRTKLTVPDLPTSLSVAKISAHGVFLTWAAPTGVMPAAINEYRWTVTFKQFLYEAPKYCISQKENTVTYTIQNDQTYEYSILNLKPASRYFIELSAATESGFGNSTNITIHTLPSTSSPVENLRVTSIKSNAVVLNWNYPCIPNGKIAFFHSTFVGERAGFRNHIFSVICDISEKETEFEYSVTNLMPEYAYQCTIVAITYTVETPGQDRRIRFFTPSTSPDLPTIYDTFHRLRVTVSESHLTRARLSIPSDLFSNANGYVQYYSIIVYQDGGFPDKPERGNRDPDDVWPPTMRSWAEAAPYPLILAYQTTPDKWMPFDHQKDVVLFEIGADEFCTINDEKNYCNGPLRPVTNYRLKVRAFTSNGYQDSWTVPFTTPGKSTAVYYLVLCSVLFAVLITAIGMYCMLNKKVPWGVKYKIINTTTKEPGFPCDMNFKHLPAKTSQEIESEYNLLNMYLKSNHSIDVAILPQNKRKNRYVNTLPYDYNRVIIQSSDNDYINASFIEDSNGTRQYIACQGPKKNTCVDMWQMILDQDVASIVMLCQTTENGKKKCEKYFPNSKEEIIFGDIRIKNDITIFDKNNSFTTSILTILKNDLKKTIRHFHFYEWADFGTPNEPSALVQFCRVVQAKSPAGLIVVHCSAGVGRTGTYIACDMLLRQIMDRTKLNVLKTVLKLRDQRTNMVQTQAQYEFVYKCLAYYLKEYWQVKSTDAEEKNHNFRVSDMNTSSTKLIQ